MAQSYRLLQNELKNQWSDLIYSKSKVIVIGATNKPHDIDMDGFGRRLSLKIYIDLPNAEACQAVFSCALARVHHRIDEEGFEILGQQCAERGFSGFDIDCIVENLLRRGLREITLSRHFRELEWESQMVMVACSATEAAARQCTWDSFEDKGVISYRPIEHEDVLAAIARTRLTVDMRMIGRHAEFARQYCGDDYQ